MPQQGGIDAPYTRLRGPLLVGQSSDFGIAAVNGGSTAPLITFWNASEFGFYVASSSRVAFVGPSVNIGTYTSGGVKFGTTGLQSTATGTGPYLYIPQTTASLSSGAAPPALDGGCAVVFSAQSTAIGTLWFYSTIIANWVASTGGATYTSTST